MPAHLSACPALNKIDRRRRFCGFRGPGDLPGARRAEGSLRSVADADVKRAFERRRIPDNLLRAVDEATCDRVHSAGLIAKSDPAHFERWLSGSTEEAFRTRAQLCCRPGCGLCSRAQSARISWPHERGPVAQGQPACQRVMMVGSAAAPARLGARRQTLCSASSRSIYLPMLAHRGPGFA